MHKLSLIFFCFHIYVVVARQSYVALNPNGANVQGVAAIGHKNVGGGGVTNLYGQNFGSAGLKWTSALCTMDSDGDGQSNGLELGDPCCLWVHGGGDPTFMNDISHPGDNTKMTRRPMPACPSGTATPSTSTGVSATTAPSGSAPAIPAPVYSQDGIDMSVGYIVGIPSACLFLIAVFFLQIKRCTQTKTFNNQKNADIMSLNAELLQI